MRKLFALLTMLAFVAFAQDKYLTQDLQTKISDKPQGLIFFASFDRLKVNADFAKGDPNSTTMRDVDLGLRGLVGFDNKNAFQPEAGEYLRYKVEDNVNPQKGTMILWTAALGHNPCDQHTDGKYRGNIALANIVVRNADRWIDIRLYECEAEVYFDCWTSGDGKKDGGYLGRCFAPRPGIRKGQWHQIACTWDEEYIEIFLNGESIHRNSHTPQIKNVQDLKAENNDKSFIGIKSPFYEDKHTWETGVDDFALYSRVLSGMEIRNQYLKLLKDKGSVEMKAYSLELNGVVTSMDDNLDRLEASFDFMALPKELKEKLDAGELTMDYLLTGPDGKQQKGSWKFDKPLDSRIFGGVDKPGKYLLETAIGSEKVKAEITRPDCSWLHNGYGDEDVVPDLWKKDWAMKGRDISTWNRNYHFTDGPLPVDITCYGKSILAKPPRLLINGEEPTWKAGKSIKANRSFTLTGTGKLGNIKLKYSTVVEYDGMIKFDWEFDGTPQISTMDLTWQMGPDNHQFLMTPFMSDEVNPKVEFKYPLASNNPSMLWFVSERKGGFAYTMVHDANWIYDKEKPVLFADKASGMCKVTMITQKVTLPKKTGYHALFITTPTRPLPKRIYRDADTRGYDTVTFVHGGGDGAFNTVFTHAPQDTKRFYQKYRNAVPNSIAVYGGACSLTTREELTKYFGKYWDIPGANCYYMPFWEDNEKGEFTKSMYSSCSACPATVYNDYVLHCDHALFTHPLASKFWLSYWDLNGNSLCKNKLHGCAFTDNFGRDIKSFVVLAKRKTMQRLWVNAHKYGKVVMLHAQRHYFPFIHGFGDYWNPGEQFTVMLQRNPYGYTDELDEGIYRSEFNRNVLGIGVLNGTSICQADNAHFKPEGYKYTEAMLAMMSLYDIDSTQQYAAGPPMHKFFDIYHKYGIDTEDAECHLFYEQNEALCTDKDIRITYYKLPENGYLLFLSNKDPRPHKGTVDITKLTRGSFKAHEEYMMKTLDIKDGKFDVKIPARSFRIVAFPPKHYYPLKDTCDKQWPVWNAEDSDRDLRLAEENGNSCLEAVCHDGTAGSCFMRFMRVLPGKKYRLTLNAKGVEGAPEVNMSVQGLKYRTLLSGTEVVVKKTVGGQWERLEVVIEVTADKKWEGCDGLQILVSSKTKNSIAHFDDFTMEEIE